MNQARQHDLAAGLAQGPAFLLLGSPWEQRVGESVVDYPWSGVYTTGTDGALSDRLRSTARTVASVGATETVPTRSRFDLQVCYLCGGDHLSELYRPAADPLEAATVKGRCLQELTRLVDETVTPKGTVVIEAWAPEDPLKVDDLYPLLRRLGTRQVHLFTAAVWRSDPFISNLVEAGIAVLHDDKLDTVLQRLDAQGALAGKASGAGHTSQRVVTVGSEFVEIDIHLWNQVSQSARPVDLGLLTPPVLSSSSARYQEFRGFIGAAEGSPRWRSIAAGMNIHRDFEGDLAKRVRNALDGIKPSEPIILAGQTATGKSVALASLALDLARGGDVVLHQSRRGARPTVEDLDQFCAWAEDRGARMTILIWDGMTSVSDYLSLSRQLQARGRRTLIVGSTYVSDRQTSGTIRVESELSPVEQDELRRHLTSFGIDLPVRRGVLDSSFLAFLYHTLPESEHALRKGLAQEMRFVERGIAQFVRDRGRVAKLEERLTAVGRALQDAGYDLDDLLDTGPAEETELARVSFDERTLIQKVTTLVLVAGQYGIAVPMDLMLRVLGRDGSQAIRDALGSFDIVRDVEGNDGDYFLVARSALEAGLLVRHEVPLDTELQAIRTVIGHLRVPIGHVQGVDEVGFLISLLERIGPNSRDGRYEPHFREIADSMAALRIGLVQPHPRLVLQESFFARRAVQWQQRNRMSNAEDRIVDLEHNREVLDIVLAQDNLSEMMRLSLTVELAATLGAIMFEVAAEPTGAPRIDVAGQLADVLSVVQQARRYDPSNFHPIDVLVWSTIAAIKTGTLTPEMRISCLADVKASIDSIDREQLLESQQTLLTTRIRQIEGLIADEENWWERLRDLERGSDPAATYFLARAEADGGTAGKAAALRRLRNADFEVRTDWRCVDLWLQLEWETATGSELLRGERQPVNLSEDGLQRLQVVVDELRTVDYPDNYKALFVQGVVEFLSGDFGGSRHTFRTVESLTRQIQRRIRTSIVLADGSGRPRIFTGRIDRPNPPFGNLWVEELGTSVRFETSLFGRGQELAPGQRLSGFIIGFKMTRGAVAEPRTMVRERKAR